MKNVKEAMAVADEVPATGQKQNSDDLKSVKRKLLNWFLGIAFSLIPLLALPFKDFIENGNFLNMLYHLCCDASILFVGISFSIVSLNDFIDDCAKREKYMWPGIILFFLIFGTFLYTVTMVTEKKDENIVFVMNLIYFIAMFLLSAFKYINEIWGRKNGID